MNKLNNGITLIKPYVFGLGLGFALFTALFFKAHWTGFTKFLADPAFFDNIEVSRNFEVKK